MGHSAAAPIVMRDVPWSTYVALCEAADEQPGVKLTYLDGTLEIMSPTSEAHEEAKKLLARLLEAWSTERGVDLRGLGGTTWRDEAKQAGLEADECYRLGTAVGVPQLAIEIVVSHRLSRTKRAAYARLGVHELWSWRPTRNQFVVYQLDDFGRYQAATASKLLPTLQVDRLVTHAHRGIGQSHALATQAWLEALRTGG